MSLHRSFVKDDLKVGRCYLKTYLIIAQLHPFGILPRLFPTYPRPPRLFRAFNNAEPAWILVISAKRKLVR